MKNLIKFEYRKLWNKITITGVVALFVLSTLHSLVYLNLQYRTIDKNGNIVTGVSSFRALKKASEDIEGVMDGEYIQQLKIKYNNSYDKKYLGEHRGFLGTAGMTKYMFPNYTINYAYYGPYMSNGNEKIGLDYDFLDSEEHFYHKFKAAMEEEILTTYEWNRGIPYTKAQAGVIEKKIEKVKTPFKVAYCQGIANFRSFFVMQYPIIFVLLAFILACTYAKDSISGVSELTLATVYGRKRDWRARWIAGNLLTLTTYLIFIGTLLLEHGVIASLQGWNTSAQTFWFSCIYNFSLGTGITLELVGGLLGALVFANLVMLLSMKIKNMKATAVISVVVVWELVRLSKTYHEIKLLNPVVFKSDSLLNNFIFLKNILIPYFVLVPVLTILYIGILQLLKGKTYRKYQI